MMSRRSQFLKSWLLRDSRGKDITDTCATLRVEMLQGEAAFGCWKSGCFMELAGQQREHCSEFQLTYSEKREVWALVREKFSN